MPGLTPDAPNATGAQARARDWEGVFLATLRQTGNITEACRKAEVSRPTAYEHRDGSERFAKLWADALEEATDALEREARRRAIEGFDKPVYQGGEMVGTIREYSDTLLIAQLKAHRPKQYRERVDISGPDGQPLKVLVYLPAIRPIDDDDGNAGD